MFLETYQIYWIKYKKNRIINFLQLLLFGKDKYNLVLYKKNFVNNLY